MFLKSDYMLMIDNELRSAEHFALRAKQELEKADAAPTSLMAGMFFDQADTYSRQAIQHAENAEYWRTFIESEAPDDRPAFSDA